MNNIRQRMIASLEAKAIELENEIKKLEKQDKRRITI